MKKGKQSTQLLIINGAINWLVRFPFSFLSLEIKVMPFILEIIC